MDIVVRARTKCEEGEGLTLTTVVVLNCTFN